MSIDFDFSLLGPSLQKSLQNSLNETFSRTTRPSFLGPVEIIAFELPLEDPDFKPRVKIIDIVDVWREFSEYSDDEEETSAPQFQSHRQNSRQPWKGKGKAKDEPLANLNQAGKEELNGPTASSSRTPVPIPISLQMHLSFHFHGPISLSLKTSVILNHPSPFFISLPVTLSVRAISIVCEILVAFEGPKRRVNISLLALKDEDGEAETEEGIPSREGYTFGSSAGDGEERMAEQILREIVVDSEIGSGMGEPSGLGSSVGASGREQSGSVLRNVGKIEKFVLEVARKALESELCYPNFHTIEF
ncbi:hypothetical protein BT69DRAFT_1129425 [Atractiella rhizophila]|nr:hypothetical protein BT69DRAFT_1129425 [Atractiella rhizophila]